MALPTFEKKRLIGLIAILSFGLTSLSAVLFPGQLVGLGPALFITGFFILIPLVLVLGEDFPLVAADEPDASAAGDAPAERPVAALRDRYASGEIDEAEFERRLDRLLATEDLDERLDRVESDRGDRHRERDVELE
ncbi:SHOCT domain-containing protein [Halorubrum sp. Atlit-8R]|uniref:SHOCT domain-containing protein n=1 Tax=unclassified Halorubrum TaxID=2642239 RepID=UPI000EF28F09|nr:MULTISPECIES: SHOCT domain-containing protein [unclassified Halorubrum]RLM63182.1 SHOCT domain-containing protein [Halorubrum sp. Atlit-9R]RLM82004.1 SHOCT domain-containing protein [Halorubrum sp. Atlit-8R]